MRDVRVLAFFAIRNMVLIAAVAHRSLGVSGRGRGGASFLRRLRVEQRHPVRPLAVVKVVIQQLPALPVGQISILPPEQHDLAVVLVEVGDGPARLVGQQVDF